ncbi:MAG TPA: ATP-binding cassette domain-containing protein, partial [Methylothermaceae bacterium]|nr:ATP-binding cassette domain-containing protein [Methylothermaceae bacterium]
MLRFDQVSKRYPGSGEVLKNVSFTVERGRMAFITGHSGAGKSTVLRLAAMMERPTRGNILLADKNITRISAHGVPFLRRRLGLIFQDYRLLYDRTVFDNVALPLLIAGFGPDEIERRTRAALNKVGLAGFERRYPVTLSGGEQQR